MISQDDLCKLIEEKGGRCYPPRKEGIGFANAEGRLLYGVGWIRLDDGARDACDVVSNGGLNCYHNGMEYDIAPGIVFPEAEAPLATEEDIARTKAFFGNLDLKG